jgi:hypothetical protein
MPNHAMQQNKAHESHLIRPAKSERKLPLAEHTANSILGQQQAFSNQFVQDILQSKLIQAKLVVNPPDDEYEKEADQVADSVMRMPDPEAQGLTSEKEKDDEEKRLQAKPISIQTAPLMQPENQEGTDRKDDEEKKLLQTKTMSIQASLLIQRELEETKDKKDDEDEKLLQAKSISGQSELLIQRESDAEAEEEKKEDVEKHLQAKLLPGQSTLLIQRERGTLEEEEIKKEEENHLQTKLLSGDRTNIQRNSEDRMADRKAEQIVKFKVQRKCAVCPKDEEKRLFQRKTESNRARESLTYRLISDLRSEQPLDSASRAFFEPRFRHDFSGVKVYVGPEAEAAARTVNAKAFAFGNNIVFGNKWYAPDTKEGRQLLAHELTHIIQQESMLSGSKSVVQRVEGGRWDPREYPAAKSTTQTRIEGDTEYYGGFALSPDEQVLEAVLKKVIADKGVIGAQSFVRSYSFNDGWSPEKVKLRERIIPILNRSMERLENYAKEYINNEFRPKAIAHLKTVLADSRKVIEKETEKYGLSRKTTKSSHMAYGGGITISSTTYSLSENKDTDDMVTAANDIINKYNDLTTLNNKRESLEEKTSACTDVDESGMRLRCNENAVHIKDPVAHKQVIEDIEKTQQEYVMLQTRHEAQYPILASFRPPEGLNQLKVIAEGSKEARSQVVGMDVDQKLKNIEEIESVAYDDKFIWKQGSIISGAKRELGVKPGSVEDKVVDTKVQDVADSEMLRRLTLGFVSLIGALLAAIPSGGSSVAAFAGGFGTGLLAGTGGLSILEGIRDYEIQKAATGNTFDKAKAISQEDPSLFWLALMIVMSVADIAMAAASFMRAAQAIRAVEQTGEFDKVAENVFKNSGLDGVVPEEQFVEGYKKFNINPEMPLSGLEHAGTLAQKGKGFGAYDGYIPGVKEPVVIKVYPADDKNLLDLFHREVEGAEAASKTSVGPKFYGEVDVGPGKKAFAMEKLEGGSVQELDDALLTPEQITRAEALTAKNALRINQKTIMDIRRYATELWKEGHCVQGDIQGLIDDLGNWRPYDFQTVLKIPDKNIDPIAYSNAYRIHYECIDRYIEFLKKMAPNPLQGSPVLPPISPPPRR